MRYYLTITFVIISMSGLLAQWNTNGTSVYYNGGNVGIGTSAPSAKLNVYNPGNGTTLLLGNPNSGSGGYTCLSLGTSLDAGGYAWMQSIKSSGSSYGDLIFNAFGGSIGIGTSNPSFKLDVEGAGVRIKNSSTASAAYTTFRIQGPNYTNGLEIDFFGNNNITSDNNWSYGGGPGSAAIVNVNAKPLTFGTNNQGRMLIDGAGNVGIGTFSPDSKLSVNGTVHAREVKVDLTGWPDYVFAKDYPLTPLEEVKTYIDVNQHLPEVPSAEEVDRDGVKLGEMNKILLKKMEEMTLYMIEMKSELRSQQSENESLKSRLEQLEMQINK